MEYKFIKTDIVDHVFYLILNRDEKRNAFTPTMINEIAHALNLAEKNDQIKVFVLKAMGSVFCAGMDLKTFQDPSLDTLNPFIENKNISLGQVFDNFNKPSIALLEGNVIAGGFLLILGCTYVFGKEEVNFKLPEISFGLFPFQVMASLLKVMPEKKVLQLCLEPDFFGMEKAIDLGIADGYYAENKFYNLLNSFSAYNPQTLMAGIKALKSIRNMESEKQYDFLLEILQSLKNDQSSLESQIEKQLKKD